jgi:peptide-methionine (S)-S-oxide reductase
MMNSSTNRSTNIIGEADDQGGMPYSSYGACNISSSRLASHGDVVTIDLNLTPENGYVPEPLFDTRGIMSFVVGWGNYLPGLHELVTGRAVGEEVLNVSVDAGWGERNPDLVVRISRSKLRNIKDAALIQVGAVLRLQGGVQATVIELADDIAVIDANPPLAGASFSCTFTILAIESFPVAKTEYHEKTTDQLSRFEVATWALGCFWGGELAFMRVPGVVGTKVGYTQGITPDPSYDDVCKGTTHHTEAIMVVYDPQIVSYDALLQVAIERLSLNESQLRINLFDSEEASRGQYRQGIYFHNDEQKISASNEAVSGKLRNVELSKASYFYDAEDYHQQYLYKGGQSARKGAKETIRCFG